MNDSPYYATGTPDIGLGFRRDVHDNDPLTPAARLITLAQCVKVTSGNAPTLARSDTCIHAASGAEKDAQFTRRASERSRDVGRCEDGVRVRRLDGVRVCLSRHYISPFMGSTGVRFTDCVSVLPNALIMSCMTLTVKPRH